jgi:hypothetical protein
MKYSKSAALLAAVAALSLAACDKGKMAERKAEKRAEQPKPLSTDPVENALSAAPPGVAKAAAVVAMNPDGTMKTLREGSNGFTCMADSPETPGPDPMCMDANAMEWAAAWIGHKPPPEGKVGLMYMLGGGTDASNTDPYAKKPGGKDWVHTGPHVMVVGAPSLTAIYKGGEEPDTGAPYVMWAGTPYAHLMVPVG